MGETGTRSSTFSMDSPGSDRASAPSVHRGPPGLPPVTDPKKVSSNNPKRARLIDPLRGETNTQGTRNDGAEQENHTGKKLDAVGPKEGGNAGANNTEEAAATNEKEPTNSQVELGEDCDHGSNGL